MTPNNKEAMTMARLPYLTPDDLAPDDRDLLARNANLYKLLVHSPDGARSFSRLGNWIRHKSRLDGRLRELAILNVGYLTQTEYEYTHHIEIGRNFGVTDDDIRALADGTDGKATGLDEVSQLVLRASREMTLDLSMREDTFNALRSHLGDEGMVDLTIAVSFYNGVIRLLKTMQIDLEPGYQELLDEFPFGEAGS